mmetsp:Transcript_13518/g.39343  ORF Transcript_13518/g.39343 Transcript_13518/m.39343 type:complete len:84 (+) Transcript_13518:133-384(+)
MAGEASDGERGGAGEDGRLRRRHCLSGWTAWLRQWCTADLWDEFPAWLKWKLFDWMLAFLLAIAIRHVRGGRPRQLLEWMAEN